MACGNTITFKKYSVEDFKESTEVDIEVYTDLDTCKKIKTSDGVATGTTPTFSRTERPNNAFECYGKSCITTGTLYTGQDAQEITYNLKYDGTEFAAGAISVYVKTTTAQSLTFTISDTSGFENADVYTLPVNPALNGEDGYQPIIVDLSKAPTSEAGDGWTPSQNGAYLKIEVEKQGTGLSTLMVNDTIEDFQTIETIKIACLSEVTFDIATSVKEASCIASGYDTEDATAPEFTLSGRLLTDNFDALNPWRFKGTAVKGFDMVTEEKTVQGVGGKGTIVLPAHSDKECGFVSIQIIDSCGSKILKRLSTGAVVDVDNEHFIVAKNEAGTSTIYLNAEHIGSKVTISYPIEADITEYVADQSRLGEKRARMTYTRTINGRKSRFVMNNALITSFPNGIGTAEDGLSFTFSVQKDQQGMTYREYQYNE